jgi:hypothetical protein
VKPIDDATASGTYDRGKVFSVTPMHPRTHSLGVVWLLDGSAIPGATAATLDSSTVQLSPGDRVVVFSDGVSEALSATGEWTTIGAKYLVDLVADYGAFVLRNAFALAVAAGIEDGDLGL